MSGGTIGRRTASMVPGSRSRPGAWAITLAFWVSVVGCGPAGGPLGIEHPDVSGDWSYTAEAIRPEGTVEGPACRITGMVMTLGPWRTTGFFGRSAGGVMECDSPYEALEGELPDYAVRRGGMVSNHIAFEIGNADWRHEGLLSANADTMSGTFRLRSGSVRMVGRFRAVRTP